MKRILIVALAFFAFALASCEKAPIGGTAVQDASGQWYVKRVMQFADGSTEDYFGPDWLEMVDKVHMLTYNTSANDPDSLFLEDLGYFYAKSMNMYLDFKVKVKYDPATMTFSATEAPNYYEDNTVDIEGGIIKDGAKTAQGKPIDSIWMTVKISDDTDYAAWLNDYYGGEYFTQWDRYLITGVRYTGLEEDD